MGIFGAKKEEIPPHPRREPRFAGPLTPERAAEVFEGCVDFSRRTVWLNNDPDKPVELLYIQGQVRAERASDYLLRPMAQNGALGSAGSLEDAYRLMRDGGIYALTVKERTTLDEVVFDLVDGWAVVFFPGKATALSYSVATEEKRSVSEPENEPDIKGARDSFVESLRTNTSLVRRRFRAPELKIREYTVGRQSLTPVDILYIEGLTDPELVAEAARRVDGIDIDALLTTGNLEEYIVDEVDTAFPLVAYTQRPDRFCSGLVEGRVGILVDGLPMGYLVPGTIDRFLSAGQDKTSNWMVASALKVMRWLCVLVTLFLPALYISAVVFQPEMIPLRLARSIIDAKANVPFSTLTEVLVMLVAFEVLQEAGVRLPSSIGQTVSILGGLVVGSAAVEARIVSPAVLVVVAIAGIAGYTIPSQDFSGAIRLWRFGLTILAGIAGLTGTVLGGIFLVIRLAGLESFGVPYLTPFASSPGEQKEGHTVLRQPLTRTKLRPAYLRTRNRRNQGPTFSREKK